MHACNSQYFANHHEESNMADWSIIDYDYNCYNYFQYYQEKDPNAPAQCVQESYNYHLPLSNLTQIVSPPPPPCRQTQRESPREMRNKAEKQRRDKMNKSIRQMASIVPTIARQDRKLNRTSVLRLAAHYLRSHQHVFGRSIDRGPEFSMKFTETLLKHLKGFLITTTYRGIVVVVSPNVQEYLGYSELDLLGQNVFTIIHKDDHGLLGDQLYPRSCALTSKGELVIPNEIDAEKKIAEALTNERRSFIIRFKKYSQHKSETPQYVACHVQGSLRKSDLAGMCLKQVIHTGRRARSRGNSPFTCGNDVVFVGMVRPTVDTFRTESTLESFKMEYRTRHSIDGEIIQCEQRIALVTGYMTHEVNGVNAMNFMHRDDVRWVIIALREMYDQHRLVGESCYRLMTKNGQFIYMRTLGRLDVDQYSNAVTSFVCTNTVVGEQEGKQLIKLMKNKFTLKTNIAVELMEGEEISDENKKETLPVEDPTLLERVILHLVTDLPSPNPDGQNLYTQDNGDSSSLHLAIIPPRKEKIHEAIAKSYSVIRSCCSTMAETNRKENEKSPEPANVQQATPLFYRSADMDVNLQTRPQNRSTVITAVADSTNASLYPHVSVNAQEENPEEFLQSDNRHTGSSNAQYSTNQEQDILDAEAPQLEIHPEGSAQSNSPSEEDTDKGSIPGSSEAKKKKKSEKKIKKNKTKKTVKKYGCPKSVKIMLERELAANLVLMQSAQLPFKNIMVNDNFDEHILDSIESHDGIDSRTLVKNFNAIIENFEQYGTEENTEEDSAKKSAHSKSDPYEFKDKLPEDE